MVPHPHPLPGPSLHHSLISEFSPPLIHTRFSNTQTSSYVSAYSCSIDF